MPSYSTTRPIPGGQRLPREFIARHQRARIIAALAEETSEQGYRAVTVADIVKRAGIARKTFYENFGSKEECFLATQELAMSTALERVVEAAGTHDDWPRRIRAGLTAFLDYVAAEPALARTCMVESLSAGPAAVEYHEESQQAFVSLLRLGRDVTPYGAELPEALEEAIVGGVFWIVYQRLANGEQGAIPTLLPELVEFALTSYLGAEAARATARADETDGARTAPPD
ncbi:MAG TPA: helix-turn-helix domain-containing protein [Solirubrobacterales bacterium]|nr:helix-turn-helix domain-containing protein [Solirubrobacterales bacterium]